MSIFAEISAALQKGRAKIVKQLIEQALEKCGGNRTKAAEMLGISRRTLQRKLAGTGK